MVTAAALPSTAAPLFFSCCLCACLTQSLDSIMGVVFDRYAAAELHRVLVILCYILISKIIKQIML
jgi:hypothetical protein